MYVSQPPRAVSALTSLALTAATVALLVFGFGVTRAPETVPGLLAIDLAERPPVPKPTERPERRQANKPAPKDDPGLRNLRNKATPIVAPKVVPLIPPPPVVVAAQADVGSAAQTGASPLPGPGRGAGTYGDGLGGGGTGGDGDGSGDGVAVRGPRRTAGRIAYGDLPPGILPEGAEAAVEVLFTVNPDGTASQCTIDHSSGYPAIDRLTCRLIEQRFRYRPATNRNGRPVRAMVQETHTWVANDR